MGRDPGAQGRCALGTPRRNRRETEVGREAVRKATDGIAGARQSPLTLDKTVRFVVLHQIGVCSPMSRAVIICARPQFTITGGLDRGRAWSRGRSGGRLRFPRILDQPPAAPSVQLD